MRNRGRRVAFARINRRQPEQTTLEKRPFGEDMRTLAESGETKVRLLDLMWAAGDLHVTPSEDAVTGVFGFEDREHLRLFDEAANSWIKAQEREAIGASLERTTVPFAVDLREDHRWVAFGTSIKIQAATFAKGLTMILSGAVSKVGLMPLEWEVDLVKDVALVEDFIERYPNITRFVRIIHRQNGMRLDEDRRQMQELWAHEKRVEFRTAERKRTGVLNVQGNPDFHEWLDGLDEGDVDVELQAGHGISKQYFSSTNRAVRDWVPDYGTNMELGMDYMLAALHKFVEDRVGSPEPVS
jgi:hypothetical protein